MGPLVTGLTTQGSQFDDIVPPGRSQELQEAEAHGFAGPSRKTEQGTLVTSSRSVSLFVFGLELQSMG